MKIILILALICSSSIVMAEDIIINNPLGPGVEFENIVEGFIDFIFNIAIILFPAIVVIAGIMFVTAGASVDKIDKAKKMLIWSSIGFMVILFAKGLIIMLERIIGIK